MTHNYQISNLDECGDKGIDFCRPYAPYCKQIKEGGPFQAFMKRSCCDSCEKLKPSSKLIHNVIFDTFLSHSSVNWVGLSESHVYIDTVVMCKGETIKAQYVNLELFLYTPLFIKIFDVP